MHFLFFGSPKFAAIVLETLVKNGFIPDAVVCNPDRPVGRKKKLTPPAVKQLIIRNQWDIRVFQPEKLNASEFSSQNYDFFVVAAYSKIIPKSIISIPRLGIIGVHPSLLPKHRGATPIQSAILEGDKTGTTLFLMDEKVDHGSILAQEKYGNSNLTYELLEHELAEISGKLLVKTVPDFIAGKISPVAQNETDATYTKKFATDDAFIDEKDLDLAKSGDMEKSKIVDRRIRAFNPEPGAWTFQNGKRVKLLEAIISDNKLALKKIQVEGKKPYSLIV